MPARLCQRCGKPIKQSGPCPRCGYGKRRPSKRTVEQERERKAKNPWRSQYASKAYKEACQKVLSRSNGCCEVSGIRIAYYVGGRWKMRPNGGIHHKVPLSQGGTNSVENLMALDVHVHNMIDAQLRRNRKETKS